MKALKLKEANVLLRSILQSTNINEEIDEEPEQADNIITQEIDLSELEDESLTQAQAAGSKRSTSKDPKTKKRGNCHWEKRSHDPSDPSDTWSQGQTQNCARKCLFNSSYTETN